MYKTLNEQLTEFVDYVLDFYGNDGIYDMGATRNEVILATENVISAFGITNFEGDTVDRERVRDVMINKFGLKFPE